MLKRPQSLCCGLWAVIPSRTGSHWRLLCRAGSDAIQFMFSKDRSSCWMRMDCRRRKTSQGTNVAIQERSWYPTLERQ